MNSPRQIFALAGILTATAITGGVAVAGLTHSAQPAAAPRANAPVLQAPTAPASPVAHELQEVD